MGKFTQKEKGLPEARPNKPPAVPKPKPEPNRPGEKTVEEDMDQEAKDETPPVEPKEEEQPPKKQEDEPRLDEKGKKRDPWTLVNNFRKRNQELAFENDELRSKTAGANGELSGEWKSKWEAMEKRNKELEDEIGFVNYRKSKEFVETYEKPFKTAWTDAARSLAGLKVKFQRTDPDSGELTTDERDLTSDDISILAQMDPSAARMEMKARFPEDWVEVKTHIDRVRALSMAQNEALAERQGKGGEWQKQQREAYQQAMGAVQAENRKHWDEINAEHVKKYEFLRPVEGDTERNEKLAKATEFVESALKASAIDPRLSPEQRREVLKKHAALRNRAIGYSVLAHENRTLKTKMAELEKSLAAYQESEPGAGEGRGRDQSGTEPSTMDAVAAGLLKYAR